MSNLNGQDYGLTERKETEITTALDHVIHERDVLVEAYKDVLQLEINHENLSQFKSLRLLIVKNRTQGINAWHKKNKEMFLAGGKFVDAIKNKEILVNQQMEANLLKAEKHFENLEKDRLSALQLKRIDEIKEYLEDAHERDLTNYNDEDWTDFVLAKKTRHFNALRIEKEAEEKRIKDIEEKRIEDEKVREDLARLKAESELKEKEQKAERKKQADILAKQKADAEANRLALEKENEANLKIEKDKLEKIEKELKAKQDAEDLKKRQDKKKEDEERKQAEILAKAPLKEQLNIWVSGFDISKPNTTNTTTLDIIVKFNAFKKWAEQQIESI